MARKVDPRQIMERREGDSSAETRWVAQLYGVRFYRTRVRCRNDHDRPRLASTGECLACTSARWSRWAARHPELAREKRERMMRDKGALPVAWHWGRKVRWMRRVEKWSASSG